jgi:hypothetical protein
LILLLRINYVFESQEIEIFAVGSNLLILSIEFHPLAVCKSSSTRAAMVSAGGRFSESGI